MGKFNTPTVYTAKLKSLVFALQIELDVHAADTASEKSVVFADNPAAIPAIRNVKHSSGRYILVEAKQYRLSNDFESSGGKYSSDES